MTTRARAFLLLIITVFLWGISGSIGKYTLSYLPSSVLLTMRFGLVTLILFALAKIQHLHLRVANIPTLIVLGIFGTIGQIGLIYLGLQSTTSIDATLIISTSPIFVAILSHFFISEHLTRRKLFGIALGLVGTLIIVINPLINSGHILTGSTSGNLLILAGNLCWAIYAVLSKKQLRHKTPPIVLTFWMFLVGFVGMFCISLFSVPITATLSSIYTLPVSVLYAILFLAIGPGIIAYICYQKALKTIDPTDADLFNYLSVLVAIPLGFFWLHEPITPSFIIGGAVIASGVIIAELLGRKRG